MVNILLNDDGEIRKHKSQPFTHFNDGTVPFLNSYFIINFQEKL